MNSVLIFICTGKDYWKYLPPIINSVNQFFPVDILLFTDNPHSYNVTKKVMIPHIGWPSVTLMRFHTFLSEREWLSSYTHIFYLDVDMLVVSPIGEEVLSDGITACLHGAFIGKKGTPEENPKSTAFLLAENIREYYTGCFFGGSTEAFFDMAEKISSNIDIDNANDFIATWHDESHLNRYLYVNWPAKVLGEEYASWNRRPETKILRIRKNTPDRPAVNGTQPPPPPVDRRLRK